MKASLVENRGDVKVSYESLVVAPRKLSVFNSDLALRIVNELVKNPGCAMDLARNLNEHEQKIYYHLRKLENVGVVKPIGTEKRYGMTARIYSMTCPVIATKLYEDGHPLEKTSHVRDPNVLKFFYPLIEDGKLNARIIAGDPYPHGKYDSGARATVHAIDILLLMGRFLNDLKFPHYQLDVDVREKDLKENLILFSSPKSNTVVEKVNKLMPVYFDPDNSWYITSKITGKVYKEPGIGVIIKHDNPFKKGKKVLLVAGFRTRGMKAASIALTQHLDEVLKNADENGNVTRIVEGLDRDGDRIIDSVRFLE